MDESTEYQVQIVRQTEKAVLLRSTKHEEDYPESWFPLSEVIFKMRNKNTGIATVDIPDWLAENKEWL